MRQRVEAPSTSLPLFGRSLGSSTSSATGCSAIPSASPSPKLPLPLLSIHGFGVGSAGASFIWSVSWKGGVGRTAGLWLMPQSHGPRALQRSSKSSSDRAKRTSSPPSTDCLGMSNLLLDSSSSREQGRLCCCCRVSKLCRGKRVWPISKVTAWTSRRCIQVSRRGGARGCGRVIQQAKCTGRRRRRRQGTHIWRSAA